MRSKRSRLLLIGLLLVAISFSCSVITIKIRRESQEAHRSSILASEAAKHLYVGMPYHEVEPYVQYAWRQYHCNYSSSSPERGIFYHDIYLFGSRNPNLAANISLQAAEKEGEVVVTQIARFPVEDYQAGYDMYADCEILEQVVEEQ